MQIQDGIEKPVIFVFHILSDQATRWGIMELELYAFVYCVKILAPYLLSMIFTIRTDHRNLLHLASSSVPKLMSDHVRVSISDRINLWRSKRGGRLTHKSL